MRWIRISTDPEGLRMLSFLISHIDKLNIFNDPILRVMRNYLSPIIQLKK